MHDPSFSFVCPEQQTSVKYLNQQCIQKVQQENVLKADEKTYRPGVLNRLHFKMV